MPGICLGENRGKNIGMSNFLATWNVFYFYKLLQDNYKETLLILRIQFRIVTSIKTCSFVQKDVVT